MRLKKGLQAMEFLINYGWAILVVLVMIGTLAYFGVLNPNKFYSCDVVNKENIVSEYGRCGINEEQKSFDDISYNVCNNLVVNDNVYPFLKAMGGGLVRENKATSIFYNVEDVELKSDIEIFKNTRMIFCSVPVELCFTENSDYSGGSYCLLMRIEVGIDYLGNEWKEWFEGVENVN